MEESQIAQLLAELAEREAEFVQVRSLLERNRSRGKDLGELQEEYLQDAESAHDQGKAAEVQLRRREAEIRETEAALRQRRERLTATGDDRQIRALGDEIAGLEQKLDALETEVLRCLEEAEAGRREAASALQEQLDQDHRNVQEIRRMQSVSEKARRAEPEILQDIERLVGMLPEGTARQVRRLRGGLDQAAVAVTAGACGGCFGQLPAQQALAAEKGKTVIRCPHCTRFVVHPPWK